MNLTHLYKSFACEVVKSSCIEISRSSKLYTWTVKGNTIFRQAFRENYTIYEGKFKTRSELLAARCEESDFTKPWLENSLWLQTLYLMALEASSDNICRIVLYCDPPTVQKPAILAEEAALTARERRSKESSAILAVNRRTMKVQYLITLDTTLQRFRD